MIALVLTKLSLSLSLSLSVSVSLQALDEFATKLIDNNHYAKEDVATRRDAVSNAVGVAKRCLVVQGPSGHWRSCDIACYKKEIYKIL